MMNRRLLEPGHQDAGVAEEHGITVTIPGAPMELPSWPSAAAQAGLNVSTGAPPNHEAAATAKPVTLRDKPRTPGNGHRKPRARLPQPGERIGQYELIRELGCGGMGAVYLARDTKLGRRVAVKFLQSRSPELTARFILEARATARCNHENIVIIYEVGEHQDSPFMVLEYLQGAPLSRLLGKGRSLPPARTVELIVPVVRALARAHEHNIVHRDLKPDNIFVTESGTVKVLDFGIAKLVQEREGAQPLSPRELASRAMVAENHSGRTLAPELTQDGALLGTLPYMSPEQWGAGTVDHRSDIWALGIMLFRMVTGKHPLAPLQGYQLSVTGMLDVPMPSLRSASASVPEELAAVIDGCLIKRKEQRIGSAQELLRALEPLLPGRYSYSLEANQSPYAGLAAFQESDAGRFFGRSRDIAAAVTRLRDQPMLAVAGPSGVGKSSFVRAGIVPALKRSGESWTSVVLRPGRSPLAALAHVMAPMLSQSSTSVAEDLSEHQAMIARLTAEPGYLGTVLRSRARKSGQRMLLFVDQFEELYTLVADARERLAFTACLASVADDATTPLRVVLSIRSDFLDRATEDEHFMRELAQGLFFLAPPDRGGLRDAIVQPAEMAGYTFESAGMVEHMLDHLQHTQGALPLLQFGASKLWDLRDRKHRLLTEAGYQQIGGIAGALASHADAVVKELGPQHLALARAVFLRLVTPERTRAIVSLTEIDELSRQPGEARRLVDQLVHARLLVVQTGTGADSVTVELVHESLVHSWPQLLRWLDETQDDAAFLDELRNAAKQWQARGRASGLLWRGEAMEEAERWYRRYRGELPELQQQYLQAVFGLAARSARAKRAAVAAVIAILTLLVAAAGVALILIRNAQTEATAQASEAHRQLERAVAAEAQANAERERAVAARGEAEGKSEELAQSNTLLVKAVKAAEAARREAEEARERAEDSKKRARHDRRRAEEKERDARAAEEKERRANAQLQELLDAERKRNEELRKQGPTNAIEDVTIE